MQTKQALQSELQFLRVSAQHYYSRAEYIALRNSILSELRDIRIQSRFNLFFAELQSRCKKMQ